MKQLFIGIVLVGLLGFGAGKLLTQKPQDPDNRPLGAVDAPFFYASPTQATSSVGIYTWSTILSHDTTRGYVALCNNADTGVNTNNPVYLGLGATSTKPFGFRLSSGECYEITDNKMFYGAIYAIASTATTTLLHVKASY